MKRWLVALCPDRGAPDPHVFTMSVPADTSGGPWRPIPCWVPGSSCTDGHALVPAEAQHLRPLLAVALDGKADTGPLIAPWDVSDRFSGSRGTPEREKRSEGRNGAEPSGGDRTPDRVPDRHPGHHQPIGDSRISTGSPVSTAGTGRGYAR